MIGYTKPVQTDSAKLRELLDWALDYIGESNAIRMIGAREFYVEARQALAAARYKSQ